MVSIEENWSGSLADREGPEDAAIAAAHLCYCIDNLIGNPNIGAIPGESKRVECDSEATDHSAVARAQFSQVMLGQRAYPNVLAIKSERLRRLPDDECALRRSVTGTEFGHGAITQIGHPDIRSIEGKIGRRIAHREGLDEIGLVGLLCHSRQGEKAASGEYQPGA